MKKWLALSLCVLFGGSLLMAGCAPKQEEAVEEQAPAMEEQAPVIMETPAADMTPAAEVPAEE